MKGFVENFSLKGKVAIVTGTTRGLGQALAEGLLEAGATVIGVDRSENEYLYNYANELKGTFKRVKIDFIKTNHKEIGEVVDNVVKEFGHIDILVNNAGISRREEVEDFTEEDWHDVLNVNLHTPFHFSKHVSRYYKEQKSGKIINIASVLSYQGGVRVPAYASTKHGLVGLTQSYANGMAKYGVNVNAIAPGFMKTELTQPLQEDEVRNTEILSRVPAGRWGDPDDLKGVLIFLASQMSNFLNGIVIPVDGGWLSR